MLLDFFCIKYRNIIYILSIDTQLNRAVYKYMYYVANFNLIFFKFSLKSFPNTMLQLT